VAQSIGVSRPTVWQWQQRFTDKLTDVVGLGACPRAGHGPDPGVDPPAHAVVLSIDEKSQIQALDRTQPGLVPGLDPGIKPGRCQTMTHDYKRHGTTTLFAALSVLDGTVIGCRMKRHCHVEFIRFLNTVERAVAHDKSIHVVLDNYATHKHPKVLAWLARHPRWTFHFIPTSASWLMRGELLLQDDAAAHPQRHMPLGCRPAGGDQCLPCRTQCQPKSFAWTKPAEAILAKLDAALYICLNSALVTFRGKNTGLKPLI